VAEDVQALSRRRRLVVASAVTAAVVAIGVPVLLAQRFTADPPAPAAASPVAAVAVSPAPSLPFDEQRPPSLPPDAMEPDNASATPRPGEVKGMPDADGCPVNASLLLAALRDSDLYQRLGTTKSLTDVDCYATYALARTEPASADPATVVFHYAETTGSWLAIGAACDDVPRAVRAHLRRCA
jgi:hypothetical protein